MQSLGPSLPLSPFPSPLPPASRGAGPFRSLRPLLWTCSVPLFCEWPAVCLGRLIFSLSFAVPQFKLVTHKISLWLPSGNTGPVLTLSNAAHSSRFRPHLLVADAGIWVLFCWELLLGTLSVGFIYCSPPSHLALQDLKTSPRPTSARVSWCLETSSIKTPFPGRVSVPSFFVSLYVLDFVLPPFKDNGLLFCVPDDLS